MTVTFSRLLQDDSESLKEKVKIKVKVKLNV